MVKAIINEAYRPTINQDEKMIVVRAGGEMAFIYYDRLYYDRTVDMMRLYHSTQIVATLPVKWLSAS